MSEMKPVNLRSFKQKVRYHKKKFKRFLTKLEKNPPRGIENLTAKLEKEVWKEVDCLTCANCCKTMTPTFTPADLKEFQHILARQWKSLKRNGCTKTGAGTG